MADVVQLRLGELTIKINRDRCIGTANCMKLAPEVFVFDDESIVSFKDHAMDIEPERVIEACKVCPVDALSVVDSHGNQLVP